MGLIRKITEWGVVGASWQAVTAAEVTLDTDTAIFGVWGDVPAGCDIGGDWGNGGAGRREVALPAWLLVRSDCHRYRWYRWCRWGRVVYE